MTAWISGKKTYIVGLLTIAKGIYDGWIDGNWTLGGAEILAGLGMLAGRSAVSSAVAKIKEAVK